MLRATTASGARASGRFDPGLTDVTGRRVLGDVWQRSRELALAPTRRNLLHWASWILCLSPVLVLAAVLQGGHVYSWEQGLTREFQDIPNTGIVFAVSSTLTNSLSTFFIVLMLAIAGGLGAMRHRGAALIVLLTFPLHVLSMFPKVLVDRPRPSQAFEGIEGVGGFQSFPSGHSEYVVTFYGFLAYLLMLHLQRPWQRWLVLVSWIILVLATGFGRIAHGRHWPLDVTFGYLIGLGLLSGLIWLHSAFRHASNHYPTVSSS